MQDRQQDNNLVLLVLLGFLGYQLWSVTGNLQETKRDLEVYQQRERRTDEVINQLRGFNGH